MVCEVKIVEGYAKKIDGDGFVANRFHSLVS